MTDTTMEQKSRFVWPIVFGIAGIIGIACWIMQITGTGPLGLNNHMMWGLYLAGFMLCTGIAAGCLVFASLPYLFEGLAPYRPYARLAAFCAVVIGAVGAGLFIMADMGNPARFWEMIAFAHVGSPLFWDTVILLAYVVVGIVFTMQLVKVERGVKEARALKPLAVIALVAGICVAITSFVFAFQVARPLWNNPGQTLSFVLGALIAAGAVLGIVFACANRSGYLPMSEKLSRGISAMLAVFVLAELVFVLAEVLGGMFEGVGDNATVAAWLVSGAGAPFFWAEMAAFAAALVLLLQKRRSLQVAGACLALLAVFLVKYNLLQAELFNPLLDYAGFLSYSGIVEGFYAPSFVEWGVSIGIVGIGALLLIVGMRRLKLGA